MAQVSSAHATLTSSSSRRQFQSCDHCRSRRRKCDAGALAIDPYSAPSAHGPRACTACARVGRACTFTWLIQRKRRRTFVEGQIAKGISLPKKRTAPVLVDRSADPPAADASSTVCTIDRVGSQSSWDMLGLLDADSRQREDQDVSSMPTSSGAGGDPWDIIPIDWCALLEQAEDDICMSGPCGNDGQVATQTSYLDEINIEGPIEDSTNHTIPSSPLPRMTAFPTPASPPHTAVNLADERLAKSANNRSVVDILISTYRANLEEVLSSWSTTSTCPYVSYSPEHRASAMYTSTTFYDRANRMDASLPRLGLEKVVSSTHAHRGMESQVLNKVVLAFASQWDSAPARRQDNGHDAFAQTLQAVMHRTLWHDARRALQKVAGPAGSFRIILARLIFSFTHNPVDLEPPSADHLNTGSHYDLHLAGEDSTAREDVCASIITDPDCLTQMERALRDLLHWRRRLHAELWTVVEPGNSLSVHQQSFLDDFNTLFWLSVMCDTTSSAVGRRPLVISDDDCAIERIHPESRTTLVDAEASGGWRSETPSSSDSRKKRISLWNSVLLKHMNGAGHLSLPFEYIDPGAIIKEAIPLKVLLFRHIGTLQVLIDQRAADYRIENAIQDTLIVYRQWQAKYGDFMDGCVEQYATMSHHLRSWHTILAAHWHYGVMLFAERLEVLDRLQLGQNCRLRERQSACTATDLALSSATQVAKLAQCCLETSRRASLSTDQSRSRLAMLSEPWCEIMVRSLAMTAETLLRSDVCDTWCHIEQHVQARHEGLVACIEVLEELGACRYKIASRIAQFLRNKLDCLLQVG